MLQRLVKPCKSFELRASVMYRCECIKRNGLQDRCMIWDCMGRPECMTKLYPVCEPGRAALLRLTDLGDVEIALNKFYHADRMREAALAQYCRLACDNARMKKILSCGRSDSPNVSFCPPPTARISDCNVNDSSLYKSPCGDPVLCYPPYAPPQPPCPKYILRSPSICCSVLKLEKPPFPCNPPPVACFSSFCVPPCPPRISCTAF